MEEDNFNKQGQLLFGEFTPSHSASKRAIESLAHISKEGNYSQFLQDLAQTISPINPYFLFKHLRAIKRYAFAQKQPQLRALFGKVVIAVARKIVFGNVVSLKQVARVVQLGELLRDIPLEELDDSDHLVLNILLGRLEKVPAYADTKILEKLQREVLVDKKNKSDSAIPLNRLFSRVVVPHSKEVHDVLKRLLMRSSSNITLWLQLSEVIAQQESQGDLLLESLSTLQQHLSDNSDLSIKIINNLSCNINSEETINSFVDQIQKLISKTYEEAKKTMYIKMLEGVSKSCLRFETSKKKLLSLFVELQSLVNSDEVFNIVSGILRRFLSGKVKGDLQLVERCRKEMKGISKYGLLIISNIITEVEIPEEVQATKEFKSLLSDFEALYHANNNKIGANVEIYLGSVNVLSTYKVVSVFPEFANANALTNFNFVSHPTELKNHFARIAGKVTTLNPKLSHDQQMLAISTFVAFCNSTYRIDTLDFSFNNENILWIISEGVYPVIFYELEGSLKLKWNQVEKAVRHLVARLNDQPSNASNAKWDRFFGVISHFHIPVSKVAARLPKTLESAKEGLSKRITEVINVVLSDETQPGRQLNLYINFLKATLELGFTDRLQPYITTLFCHKNYTDVKSLNVLDAQINRSFERESSFVNAEKERLGEYQFKLKSKPKRVVEEKELKMLDENEVKEQILREHYQRMCQYYNKLVLIVRSPLGHLDFQKYICGHYKKLLECQPFPELRFQFYLFNRNLFDAEPQYRRHSEFLSELYINVGMNVIPSPAALDKLNVFMSALMNKEFKSIPSHLVEILEYLTQFILGLGFDISLKLFSVKFYLQLAKEERFHQALQNIYPLLIENINLLSQFPETQSLLVEVLKVIPEERFEELLEDVLNYLNNSKRISLQSILLSGRNFTLSFEDYVKLRILAAEDAEIAELATQILTKFPLVLSVDQLKKFKMTKFVERHSKEVSERLCNFAKEVFADPLNIAPLFDKAIDSAQVLYLQKFDQEGLEFFPSFILTNLQFIPSDKLENIFEILIKYYTSDDQMVSLNKKSMEAGIAIIKHFGAKESDSLLDILERLMKSSQGIASIIFLGVLAPYLKEAKNMNLIQKRITEIFESNNENIQRSVSKCMHELMSFFGKPKELVAEIYQRVVTLDNEHQIGQSYLLAGLLKGIGIKEMVTYLDKILQPSDPKNIVERKGKLYILSAFFDNFGRTLQPKIFSIIKVIAVSMSDNNEALRDISKLTAKRIMRKLSAFAIKIILPQLLTGLENQEHWRGKTTYIWILGNMSHCAPRQLHACLPKIIPTLSACLSDTHPKIRETSTDALKVIGETIKNPEIFNIIDILIDALSDPFNKSKKALNILLKTRFSHFIDPPALSVIVPILNYALRGRDTILKQYACQVIGSIVLLIEKPDDLLPYLEFMSEGIRVTLCDPLAEIRTFASRAIGKISHKIGIANTEKYLSFIRQILDSETATSIERQGAAQGLSEYICTHGIEYFEQSLATIYKKLQVAKSSQKQGYISIFIFVPSIMKADFEPFIKELTDNMTIFVSDEEESIRNSSLHVQKILISNFGLSHTDMLLEPLEQNLFEDRWRKRNGALLLIGEMLNVLKNHIYENTDLEKETNYYEALMGIYILKDDEVEMPRITANQIWNTYIENTPKTIKSGIPFLIRMWSKGISEPASNVVYRSIFGFCTKYAETYFTEVLGQIVETLDDPSLQSGTFEILGEFVKRLNSQFLLRYKENFRAIFDKHLFESTQTNTRLVQSLSVYVEKMHEMEYLENKLKPILAGCDSLGEEDPAFSSNLHLFASLCSTSSKAVTELVARKILQPPLSDFKIEILLNNSHKLADYAYSKGIVALLNKEIEREINSEGTRAKSLVYCLKETSTSLDLSNKNDFLKILSMEISLLSKTPFDELPASKQKVLEIKLDLLNNYLESVSAEETPSIQQLIQQISPLCLASSPSTIDIVNKILLRLFMHPEAKTKSLFFRQFIVSIENSFKGEASDHIPIWADETSVKTYTTLLINSLCFGGVEAFSTTLTMIELFFKMANSQYVKQEAIRFVGATLRVTNYRLGAQQRIQLHTFINYMYRHQFPLQGYQFQASFAFFRFIEDTDDLSNIKLAAENFTEMLMVSAKKTDVMSEFVNGLRKGKEYMIMCLFHLVKNVLNREVLGDAILRKLYTELSQILNLGSDMEIESVYYLSRTVARLAVHLKVPKAEFVSVLQGTTYSYGQVLQYLSYCYYSLEQPELAGKMDVYLKDSSREKVHYLLKMLVHMAEKFPSVKEEYSGKKVKKMINENILGFEEIEASLEHLQ